MYRNGTLTARARCRLAADDAARLRRASLSPSSGPSGSGKTTLLSMLGGMLAPIERPSVARWADRCTTRRRTERAQLRLRKIGFVFQTFNLIPYLSALENVQIPLMLGRVAVAAKHRERVCGAARARRLGEADASQAERAEHRPAAAGCAGANAGERSGRDSGRRADGESRSARRASRCSDFLASLCGEGRTVIMVTHDPVGGEAGRADDYAHGRRSFGGFGGAVARVA